MTAFLTVIAIHFLALLSPGPDFAMIARQSLTRSRGAAVWTAVGLGMGMLVHAAYCLLGIGLLIARSILLYNAIKWIGAAYLIWIGIQCLRSTGHGSDPIETTVAVKETWSTSLRTGFLTNVLNPKATLFMLALFTQVIDPATPLWLQIAMGLYMGAMTTAYFTLLGNILSLDVIRQLFARAQKAIDRFMGVVLILLGLKVAFSSRD